MYRDIRARYLRAIGPAFAGLLLIGLLLLWISGFGFVYLFRQPLPLETLSVEALPGSYVTVPVSDLGETFAFLGYQDTDGHNVVRERYCVYLVGERYLAVRVPQDYVHLLEKKDNAASMVTSGEIGSVLELNLGELRGTVSEEPNAETQNILRSWLLERYIREGATADGYSGTDLSPWRGADGALDAGAYLDAVILPLQMETGHWGARSEGAVKRLSAAGGAVLLLALALLASVFCGVWERPTAAFARRYGKQDLVEDYRGGAVFTPRLRVGARSLWLAGALLTRPVRLDNVIWAYPRSRRLEGGKQRWSLVLKTLDAREYAVCLGDTATVQQAMDAVKAGGYPLATGFDKDKQKLYQKDIATFKARAANGTL